MPEKGLERRFVRLRRDFVVQGYWGRLCHRELSGGGTAAPVMNLLACGYAQGASCLLNRLAALSGVTKAALQVARRPLQAVGAVEFLAGPRRGVWRFRPGRALMSNQRGSTFYFPGRLVSGNYWASWTTDQRSLVFTLAALAMGAVRGEGWEPQDGFAGWFDVDTVSSFEDDMDVLQWLEEIGATELDKYGQCAARRVGHTDSAELATLSGLPGPRVASRLLAELEESTNGELLTTYCYGDSVWYHLPSPLWEPLPSAL
jgi:hypothetical protein